MSNEAMRVYERHVAALMAPDLDAVVSGYAMNAVLADTNRIGHGHEHIRAVFEQKLEAASRLEPELEVYQSGNVVFVSWRAKRSGGDNLVGGETFVVADGLITVHTSFVTETSSGAPPSGRLDV